MVQTAEPWHRNHPAIWARISNGLASSRCLFLQPEMRSVIMVVANVLVHETLEMPLVEDNHVIQQVSPTVADEAFCYSVLPRAAEAGPFWLDPKALDGADDLNVEVAPAIEYQILRGGVVREGLAQLMRDPCAGRMPCDAEVQKATAIMRDDEEAVDHPEGESRHGEEVHRGNDLAMVAQECRPALGRLLVP